MDYRFPVEEGALAKAALLFVIGTVPTTYLPGFRIPCDTDLSD